MLDKIISNRYKITEELTQDNLSITYKAIDQEQNQPVFVKIFKDVVKQRPLETLLRFRREVEKVSGFEHPNILKVYANGEYEGKDFVVTEYFEGQHLSSYVYQPMDVDEAVHIILQVSSALDLAHQKGIDHRGINPDSILVSKTEGYFESKLANFGEGLLVDLTHIKEKEEIIRTFGYLSPEQSGILRKPIDHRSDIYSLGIVFYQLLTGQLPYRGEDVSTLIHQHIAQRPESPVILNVKIPLVIGKIVLRLISKEPQERYQTLSGLTADMQEYQRQEVQGKENIDFEIARSDRLRKISYHSRLIGRDEELNILKSYLDKTKSSQGSFCLVFGEPGVGKSRLVDELRGYAHSQGGIFTGGKCYQYEFRTPYKVFNETIEAYVDKVKRLSKEDKERTINRIKEAIGELGGEVVKIAPSIKDLIGQPPELVELEAAKERLRFLITVTNFILSLATPEVPLVMFLDDLQWSDEGTIDLVSRIAERIVSYPILLIGSFRDTEVDKNHPLARAIQRSKEENVSIGEIPVRLFEIKETTQMLSQILMEKEQALFSLAKELNDKSKGNPFFLLELLRTLVDNGVVYFKDDHYTYDIEKIRKMALPANIVEIVIKRIDEMPQEHIKILSYASVMGKEVQFEMLVDLIQKPFDAVLNAIESGIKEQLLMRDITGRENIYFMHDRIREAFYKRVPDQERIPLHRHVAQVLEMQNKDDLEPVIYDLAYHFTQAEIEEKAFAYSLQAAHKAKRAYAHSQSIDLYLTARRIMEAQGKTNESQYAELLENLGEEYRLAARFDESIETFKNCASVIPEQNRIYKAQVLTKMGYSYFEKGEIISSIESLEHALGFLGVRIPRFTLTVYLGILKKFIIHMLHSWFPKIFVSSAYKGDPFTLTKVRIFDRLAHYYYFYDIIKAFYVGLELVNLAEKLGPSSELAYAYTSMGNMWASTAWFSRTFKYSKKGLMMSQQIGDRIREGSGFSYLSYVHYVGNREKESFEYSNQSIKLLKSLGEYWDLGVACTCRNYSSWLRGNLKDAVEYVEDFISISKETKVMQNLCWALRDKANLYAFIGGIDDEIIECAKEARALAEKIRNRADTMYSLSILGYLYSRNKNYEDAIRVIEEAIALFPTHYNRAPWILSLLHMGAQVYLEAIVNTPSLPGDKRRFYLKRAKWFAKNSFSFSKQYVRLLGWAYQVNGTYHWLAGRKKKAVKLWEKGIKFLREQTEDKYRLSCILMEEASALLKDNPGDKKAQEYLVEAKELFMQCGCKVDLERTNRLLEGITTGGEVVESREVLTQRRHLDSLLSVTKAIGSVFVLEELLEKIMDYALTVTGAERGFLLLYDDKSTLKLKVARGIDDKVLRKVFSYEDYRISLEMVQAIEKSHEAMIVSSEESSKISSDLKEYEVKQAICLPLKAREKLLGIIYLDNSLAGGMFGRDELELMKSFAVQASVSIENAYLVSSLVEQERLKQEMELGRKIQKTLLPQETPEVLGLKVEGLMETAQEIGGDYYDFISYSPEKLGVVVADVSGKGLDAGMVMGMTKATIYSLAEQSLSPRDLVLSLNKLLCKQIYQQKFISLIYAEYTSKDSTFTWAGAGHEHVLVYRASESKVEVIKTGGIILGMVDDIDDIITQQTVILDKGDKIILYTDGVTEARSPQEEMFGLLRLVETIKSASPSLSANGLLQYIKEQGHKYIQDAPQYDDITLVVLGKEE